MSERSSRRSLRHRSLCSSASPSSSTSAAELGTRPFLAGPRDVEEDGGALRAVAEGFSAPPAPSGCLSLLRNRCWPTGQGRVEDLAAALRRFQTADKSKQLQALWALEAQLSAHLHLLASSTPPLTPFHASITTWHGSWRPSTILSLVPLLSGSTLSRRRRHLLDEAIHRFKVEEAVLDEEMLELCSMGILSLLSGDGGAIVERQRRAAERARQLRCGVLELVVGKMMEPSVAAEFLFRLSGFWGALGQLSSEWKLRVGELRVGLQL